MFCQLWEMMMVYKEVEHPDLLRIIKNAQKCHHFANELYWENFFSFLGSGKASLALVLGYLRREGVFPDKMHEIVVPGWLGFWVYNQIQPFAFPSRKITPKSRAILVYHQYGFPQNMDKILDVASKYNLVVIEDCAHAIYSKYKDKIVGTFGDFAIYSFSKFCFCFALGGVRWKNDGFREYMNNKVVTASYLLTLLINIAKITSEYSLKYPQKTFQKWANYFLDMTYALYGSSFKFSSFSRNIFINEMDAEVSLRTKRYLYFLDRTNKTGICDHLEQEGICPYIIPIKVKQKDINNAVNQLKYLGIQTGIYQFDVNRFLLEPKFEPCVWVMCHGALNDYLFEKQIDAIMSII